MDNTPDNTPLEKVRQKRQAQADKQAETAKTQSIIDAIKSSGGDTKDSVTTAMHDLLLATLVAKDPRLAEVSSQVGELLDNIAKASDNFKNSGLDVIPKTFSTLVEALKSLPGEIAQTDKSPDLIPYLKEISANVKGSKSVISPVVDAKVDLQPLMRVLERVEKAVKDNKTEIPASDFSELEAAMRKVEKAINSLSFPVPNYILPFKDVNGKATQVQLDASGNVPTSVSSIPTHAVTNAGLTELEAAINSSKVDVNIVSSDIATGGTSAADDADFTAGTTSGTPAMGVYESTPTSVTDGDLGTVGITVGRRLKTSTTIDAALPAGTNNIGDVDVLSSALPTGAATSAKQDTEITALQLIDDIVHTGDASLGKYAAIGAVYDDATVGTVTENNAQSLRMSSRRALYVETPTSGIFNVTSNDGAIATESTLSSVLSALAPLALESGGNLTAIAGSLVSIDGAVATEATLAAINAKLANGSGTAAGALRVELPTNGTGVIATVGAVTAITNALPAGTNAIGKLAANSGVDIGDVDVTSIPGIVGTIADDSTTPGAPVMVGGMAKSPDGTDPGSVSAENDVARVYTDLNRRMLVNDEHPRWWSYHVDGSSALTDASVQADPGDGFQIVITDIIFSNGAATAINMFLEEGSTKILGPIYLEAINGRGFVWKGKKHVTASTAVTITTSSATAHSVEILGYIQAV